MKYFLLIAALFVPLFGSGLAFAQVMTSTTYAIQADSVNVGGTRSSSASYTAEDTAGEAATGDTSSASYNNRAGYQAMTLAAVVSDVTAPSVPVGVGAAAVSSSQVQVTWSSSTDDIGVNSYNIYRGGVLAGNVSGSTLNFVDTGLSASTAYSYTVSALDLAGNQSAQSSSASATTLAAPVSSAPAASASGPDYRSSVARRAGAIPTMDGFVLTPIDTAAYVYFTTALPVKAVLTLDPGTAGARTFKDAVLATTHRFLISDLSPHTAYTLDADLTDASGLSNSYRGIAFRTLSAAPASAVSDVSGLSVDAGASNISLAWAMPADPYAVGVRIVRSTEFYPSSPEDGAVIFDGAGTSFIDTNVKSGTRYYYAVFTESVGGAFSSGAVGDARIGDAQKVDVLGALPKAGNVDPMIAALTLGDFAFVQNNRGIALHGGSITVDPSQNLTVALPYNSVPQVLKTIVVTLTTTGDAPQSFSFMLRANAGKTNYEATIGALGARKNYLLTIRVVDFKDQGMKEISGSLRTSAASAARASGKEIIAFGAVILGFSLLGSVLLKKEV